MSATLHAAGLSAGHGERTLFSDLDLTVAEGDVFGLVGANGAGKSTLLTLLAGQGTADFDGTITLSPPDAEVGYLAQEAEFVSGESVRHFLCRRVGVAQAQSAMDEAAAALADGGDDLYSPALERWLHLGGADFDERAEQVTSELGLTIDLDAPMTTLSGGQVARVGLAALLLSRYDILLLDEPTNDLDLDGLDQLEIFVRGARTPLVIVSHDREFLARTVTGIIELDLAQQQVSVYSGGYKAFLVEREVARQHARDAYDQYADTKNALTERAQMQRGWMEHGVRNARRKSKDNDKMGRAVRLESTEKQAAKARQTQRRIERLDEVAEPRKEWELRMEIATAPRSGTVVATLNDAAVVRDGFTLGPISTQVNVGDRIVITGANGSGKSTLLGLLLGTVTPDQGTAVLGAGVLVGEVDQARALFTGETPLADAFAVQVPDLTEADVRTLLAKFGLRGHHVMRPADSLSPGERTRAALALLQARGVNLLVLDEPTNHLDLPAIEQLEQAVESFSGTVLLVTHDRRMLATARSTRKWRLDAGRLSETVA
ncbi:MAG: heme ABC transporter ATP-binding protein [Gordonia sp. (in: high G+C Gram-positive bacteria)]|nr:MAG: heme ABC transporter ATP-binding protein [Gordonia sp. (in: high G+C Gram-positive bacteria)]